MKKVEQTGLLFKINPSDYKLGSSPLSLVVVNNTTDWSSYLPSGERQNNLTFFFDTLSCATFSGLNDVETQIKYLINNDKLPLSYLEYLNELGFDNDEFNGSDRFTAIMSGTTKDGNYLQNIWDSFRKDGILVESMFPFETAIDTWEKYHDKSKITKTMIDRAKKILEVFSFSYEWVITGDETKTEKDKIIKEQLQQAPLHAACNSKRHAVEIYKKGYFFNSYEPYIGNKVTSIQFALKGIVTINDENKVYTTMRVGSKGLDVKKLQGKLGLMVDGSFGPKTKQAVIEFQKRYKLQPDGVVGPSTREKLNNL